MNTRIIPVVPENSELAYTIKTRIKNTQYNHVKNIFNSVITRKEIFNRILIKTILWKHVSDNYI